MSIIASKVIATNHVPITLHIIQSRSIFANIQRNMDAFVIMVSKEIPIRNASQRQSVELPLKPFYYVDWCCFLVKEVFIAFIATDWFTKLYQDE
uniref:Uncharacterized protein n=1 Tax=Lutzomyia longipalpis TaxID=7200 RepID=A0A1B0CFA1_LUTLO